MKNIFIISFITAIAFSSCQQNPDYTIIAEFVGQNDATYIYMQLVKDGELESVDSAQIVDAKVKFKGTLESPQMVYLKVGDSKKVVNFFGENSEIDVKVNLDDLENTVIIGSAVHDEFLAFKDYMSPIDERNEKLREERREAYQNGDTEKIQELRAVSEKIYNDQQDMLNHFIADNSDSYMAPFVIKRYLVYELDENQLDSMLQQLNPTVHNSLDYVNLSERVEILKKVAIGQPAVDFTLNNPEGNPVALSSFRGKILLLDFWASWCGPCRRENPNVVKLYSDYRDKGFDILGVSLDSNRDKWLDAIDADSLTWSHVSELKGWKSSAGKVYGINSIPATVLINGEGIIVAKNLRGEALRQKLEELYQVEEQNI